MLIVGILVIGILKSSGFTHTVTSNTIYRTTAANLAQSYMDQILAQLNNPISVTAAQASTNSSPINLTLYLLNGTSTNFTSATPSDSILSTFSLPINSNSFTTPAPFYINGALSFSPQFQLKITKSSVDPSYSEIVLNYNFGSTTTNNYAIRTIVPNG